MEEAVHPDWSGLPEDLTAMVMRSLDIPDLFSAGAVCTSWYAAYSAVRRVRIPITDASPCLLYSCAADDDNTATLFSPSTGAAFKVRLPFLVPRDLCLVLDLLEQRRGPFISRTFVGSEYSASWFMLR
ncbi:hypothetical protein HU200_034482 [Digitaria exilis]|uniref:F-box domain-containing protein n=1 Tax=Digitaria exilis TaxID=1010633 RepID=A0A835BJP5_9POAL|nr:hypothetical protein HU200_034482 [Digitaria exilis]